MAKQAKKKSQRTRASLFTKVLVLALLAGIGWQLINIRSQVEDATAEKARLEAQVQAQQQANDALAADIAEGNTQEKMEEIARRYSPQIASRIEGEYQVLPFFGRDIRIQKKER